MLAWILLLVALAGATGLLGFVGVTAAIAGPAQFVFAGVLLLLVGSIAVAALRRR